MSWTAEQDILLVLFLVVSVLAVVISIFRAWRGPKGG